jgi:hypothetical protein
MTQEELKQTDWYKQLPQVIQQAVCEIPPIKLYKFKSSGKQCEIYSFEEPQSGKLEDVTCTVKKTGIGGLLEKFSLNELDMNFVFNVKINELEDWID